MKGLEKKYPERKYEHALTPTLTYAYTNIDNTHFQRFLKVEPKKKIVAKDEKIFSVKNRDYAKISARTKGEKPEEFVTYFTWRKADRTKRELSS